MTRETSERGIEHGRLAPGEEWVFLQLRYDPPTKSLAFALEVEALKIDRKVDGVARIVYVETISLARDEVALTLAVRYFERKWCPRF